MEKRHLPPMKTIVVFEAVARHRSFIAAAQELNVTNSAISQSIKKLEDFTKTPLFERDATHVTLTPKGEIYYLHINEALNTIENATKQLLPTHNRVTINIIPTLAMLWLIPMMPGLSKRYPNIDLHIATKRPKFDFMRDNLDLAIVCEKPLKASSPFHSHLLWQDELVLAASPYLKIKTKSLQALLKEQKCIIADNPTREDDWAIWCKALKLNTPPKSQQLRFETTLHAIQATCNGLGIFVTHAPFINQSVAENTLIKLYDKVVTNNYFQLIHPKETQLSSSAETIKNWLLAQKDK